MSAHSAVKDLDNAYTDQTLPAFGMRELFGVEIDSFQTYQPPSKEKNSVKFTDGVSIPINVFAENLKPIAAKVIGIWDRDYIKNIPAVTENIKGKGKAVYYGSFFNLEAARYLLKRYGAEQKIQPLFTGFPDHIETTRRTKGNNDYYFILNHKNEGVSLKINTGFFDMLEGKDSPTEITLPPFGYKVLRKSK